MDNQVVFRVFNKCVLMDISDLIRHLTFRAGAGCAVAVAALRACLLWLRLCLPPARYPLETRCKAARRRSEA
jgi:hypothetical protein